MMIEMTLRKFFGWGLASLLAYSAGNSYGMPPQSKNSSSKSISREIAELGRTYAATEPGVCQTKYGMLKKFPVHRDDVFNVFSLVLEDEKKETSASLGDSFLQIVVTTFDPEIKSASRGIYAGRNDIFNDDAFGKYPLDGRIDDSYEGRLALSRDLPEDKIPRNDYGGLFMRKDWRNKDFQKKFETSAGEFLSALKDCVADGDIE